MDTPKLNGKPKFWGKGEEEKNRVQKEPQEREQEVLNPEPRPLAFVAQQ